MVLPPALNAARFWDLITQAIENDHVDAALHLLRKAFGRWGFCDSFDPLDAFQEGCYRNQVSVVKLLVEELQAIDLGLSVDPIKVLTPKLAWYGHYEMLDYLVPRGVEIDPLVMLPVAQRGDMAMARYFLHARQLQVNRVLWCDVLRLATMQQTPCHFAFTRAVIEESFVDIKSPRTIREKQDFDDLMAYACFCGNVWLVRALGAEMKSLNKHLRVCSVHWSPNADCLRAQPLLLARAGGQAEAIIALLDMGAAPFVINGLDWAGRAETVSKEMRLGIRYWGKWNGSGRR
jgi:hypothetical protein